MKREPPKMNCHHGTEINDGYRAFRCKLCDRETGIRQIVRDWIRNSNGPPPKGIERLISDAADVYDGWMTLPIPGPVTRNTKV